MNAEHRVEPRDVLPYTDEEIRELYFRAEAARSVGKTAANEATVFEAETGFNRSYVAVFVLVVALYTASFVIVRAWQGLAYALVVSALVFIVEVLVLAKLIPRKRFTPTEVLELKSTNRLAAKVYARLDPTRPEVLEKVVGFVAKDPLEQEAKLENSIKESLERIDASLQELPQLQLSLSREMEVASEEGMRLLLEAKREAASNMIFRLETIRDELTSQLLEAKEAILPIQMVLKQFENIKRLSESLSRIQAAHGLVEESEERMADHRLQLKLLWAVSNKASARLKEIQNVVEAREKAEAEIL